MTLERVLARDIHVSTGHGAVRTALALGAVTAAEQVLVGNTVGLMRLPGPAAQFAAANSLGLLVIGAICGLVILAWALRSRFMVRRPAPDRWRRRFGSDGGSRLVLGLAALSGMSTLTTVSLVVLIAIHSPLLPNTALPSPPGPHDQNLEVRLTAIQASSYLIPGDPSSYSLANLPSMADVVERPIAKGAEPPIRGPYRIVLSVHSLRTSGSATFIEAVSLRVQALHPAPGTIRVWERPSSLDYGVNPYTVVYAGQPAGTAVAARYAGAVPQGHVQLSPQETDELTIDVSGSVDESVQFQLEVTYLLSDRATVHTFVLPITFGVTFVEDASWVRYTLVNGRLVPG